MSRPLRLEFPGAIYHVTSRGDRREPIYRDDDDRQTQLDVLAQAMDRFDAEVLAYCQMGNHFHLVLHTRDANLSRVMRHLNGVYTQCFNRRHGLVGHLFQGRFKAILVDRDAYLLSLCRYVERNPVAAGLVRHAVDWRWSSAAAHLGRVPSPQWLDVAGLHGYLLGRPAQGAADQRRAAAIYAEMIDQDSDSDLWQRGLRQQVFLGDEAFVGRILHEQQRQLGTARAGRDGVPKRQTRRPASLESILAAHEDRAQGMRAAYVEAGVTMSELARHLGLSVSRVSRLIAQVEAQVNSKGGSS